MSIPTTRLMLEVYTLRLRSLSLGRRRWPHVDD